jgi:branched-chain amino acid transport system permease protein
LEATSALLQSWLGGGHGGVQLTVYSLILVAVVLYRPTGLIGVLTDAYHRVIHAGMTRAKEVPLDG